MNAHGFFGVASSISVHVQGHRDSVIVSMLDYLIFSKENIVKMYHISNFHYN
jgi:hypothetical protein